MLRMLLNTLGLALASDVDMALRSIDHSAKVSKDLVAQLSRVEAELAETKTALMLSQRESAAHARTAQRYCEIAEASLDIGASCVGVVGPCGGKFSHFILQLGIKRERAHYEAIEVQRLVANNKNRARLEEIAGKINAAAGAKEKPGSLLRPATVAPELAMPYGTVTGRATGGKPKGFA